MVDLEGRGRHNEVAQEEGVGTGERLDRVLYVLCNPWEDASMLCGVVTQTVQVAIWLPYTNN